MMQSYLFIGGNKDVLKVPVPPDLDAVQLPVHITGSKTYIRDTLAVGDVRIIYRHESLTSEQVLDRVVQDYKAWSVNRPGARRRESTGTATIGSKEGKGSEKNSLPKD